MGALRQFSGAAWLSGLGLLVAPLLAGALNLGEAEVHSRLGQKLDLTIPVIHDTGDEVGVKLDIRLADRETFAEAGIEEVLDWRHATLSFETGRDGVHRIRVRSEKRVLEPIVPFIIDVRQGRVLVRRTYAVLVDPPEASETVQVTVQAPVTITQPVPASAAAPATGSAPPALPAASPSAVAPPPAAVPATAPAAKPARRRAAPPALSDARVVIMPGESLGQLAQRVRRNPATPLNRMMDELYAANPQAFGGNPDTMWAGVEIRVPLEQGVPAGAPATAETVLPDTRRPEMPWTSRFAGRLSLTLSRLPTEDEIAQAAGRLAGETAIANRLSETLVDVPAIEPTVEAAPEAGPTAATEAAAAPQSPAVPVAPVKEKETRGFWRTALPLAMLGLLAWAIGFRRGDDPAGDAPAAPVSRLPAVTQNLKRVEAQPPAPREQTQVDMLAAVLPEVIAAKPDQPPAPAAVEPREVPVAPAAVNPTIPLAANEGASTTPAPGPGAAAAPEAAATASSKVVAMPGVRRRDDAAIEVSETALPEATGGLSGFYSDVAQMLTSALEANPTRKDLRLKLLEVYFAAGMADEFLNQTRVYLEELKGKSDDQWPEIAEMGRQLYPGHEWFSVGTPPVLGVKAAVAQAPKRNYNRYYEGVDQWKLRGALEDLATQYAHQARDPSFALMKQSLLQQYAGRPSPLVHAAAMSVKLGGAQVYLKREPRHGYGHDHLINAINQVALAKRMGRKGVVTATSNGLHGLAVAIVARAQQLECRVFIEEKDARANHARVLRMKELGAELETVRDSPDLPDVDSRRSALAGWLEDPRKTMFISSLASGPHPYPTIMQDGLALVGRETRNQMQQFSPRPPSAVIAGTADGPAVIGLMYAFIDEPQTRLYCTDNSTRAATLRDRLVGNSAGGMREHDWPREHAWLRDTKKVQYGGVSEQEGLQAMTLMYESERLMLSEEGSRVIAYTARVARELTTDHAVVAMLPSQNDADAHFVERSLEAKAQSISGNSAA